ncbi:Gp15 family bacteriophage protein [Listeria booriae]|uniref:Gp15 family bacteriophage protein n=1 Tax=Listeria booriae TaxID=1552123 RepID=UPI00162785F5|nr:Gp15 family bacteriophage protein [Listeria booriae]MBC1892420.1 hypothetical protein [Listeria booriae]
MLSLSRSLENTVIIDDAEYDIDLSFDNVLLVYEAIADESLNPLATLLTVLQLLFVDDVPFKNDIDAQIVIYKNIMETYIQENAMNQTNMQIAKEETNLDEIEEEEEYFSLIQDANYIYASFLFDYKIDLIDMQGKLHWHKFKALLTSLSEQTMFSRVVNIRQQKIDKNMSKEEKESLRQQKEIFALEKSQSQLNFDAMDLAEKEAYARKMMQEGGDM